MIIYIFIGIIVTTAIMALDWYVVTNGLVPGDDSWVYAWTESDWATKAGMCVGAVTMTIVWPLKIIQLIIYLVAPSK